ncbi:MAG: DPP IV N-terminal domain-containing protein [Chloroflexota bacterium]
MAGKLTQTTLNGWITHLMMRIGSASLTLVIAALILGALLPPAGQIAYAAGQPRADLYLVDVGRSLSARMSPFPEADNIEPAWSPDGKRLAFISRSDADALFHLFVMDVGERRVQALAPDLRANGLPAWSPDGRKIAFPVVVNGSPQTAIAIPETGETYILNLTGGSDSPPMWSPAGKWVMYLSYRDGNPRLYAADVDCNQLARGCRFNDMRIMRSVGVGAWPPSWSPDGRTLVFTAALRGDTELYLAVSNCPIVSTDCMENVRRITDNSDADYAPSWSPHGKQIAFISNPGGMNNLYLMDVQTGETRRLTANGVMGEISWSPDGKQIALVTLSGGRSGIDIVDITSGSSCRLTNLPIMNSTLSWRPAGN